MLILGSMPGIASLQAQRYYAHPRNGFWPIISELCGFDVKLPYEQRLDRACDAGIALWDVLASCARKGSLDSDIDPATARANDFAGFLATHRDVSHVFCNGATAFKMFHKRVVPELPETSRQLRVRQLPSTSPAHASMTRAGKWEVWRRELAGLLR